ncbi:hypothetical protein MnTg02_02033 [bacterium MnTg02]|nr:hypothetical protein MnTg02_02033 [bacterium MnTg02]
MAHKGNHPRQIGLGLERIGLIPLRFPVLTLLVLMAITGAAIIGLMRLKVDDSLSELFRSDSAEFKQYQLLTERFPSSEFDVLVVIEGENLLDRDSLISLRNLVIELQFVEAMTGLVSLFSARQPPERDKVPPPLFPSELPEGEDYQRLIEQVRANQIIRGKLLSDDGTLALIVIALDRKTVESRGLRDVVGEIQQTVKEHLQDTGLRTRLSGAPVMQLEIRNAVERDRLVYNGLGFLVGAMIAIVFFRRVSLMIIAAAPPAIAIVWSLGAMGWLGFRLNMFLGIMSPLIMVMAFSDTMQITFAMRDRLLAGDDRFQALRYAILTVGPACVLTVATAAASFITLLFSDSALIRTFGAAGALSTVIAYVAVITLVPLLGVLLLRNDTSFATTGEEKKDWAMDLLRGLCSGIADRVVARPVFYAIVSLCLVVIFGFFHITLEPRYRLADQVPDREQALVASSRLDAKLTGANPIHVLIELPKDQPLYSPTTLGIIKQVHEIVERRQGVGNVWSVETLRRWLEEGGETDIAILKQYVALLPEHLTRRFITGNEDAVVVTGRVPDKDASELLPVIDGLDRALADIRRNNPEFKLAVTGLAAIAARNSASMIKQLNWGLTAEMVFVAALIGLAFRSLLIAFVSIFPGLFPIFASGTLLALTGEGLQFASIVALTVAFGLGLDATIHFLNRLQLEDRPDEDPAIGVKRATVLIGPALILTTIVLAFGLAVTVFSDLPSLRLFGRLCAITLTAALIGDLLILPSAIMLIRSFSRRRRATSREE